MDEVIWFVMQNQEIQFSIDFWKPATKKKTKKLGLIGEKHNKRENEQI